MSNIIKFVLASQSPRRREILEKFGIVHKVESPTCEEISFDGKISAVELAETNSMLKCEDVAKRYKIDICNCVIIGCDTVASYNNQIIGKPDSVGDAKRILRMLSGTLHEVISGITIIKLPENKRITTHDVTRIQMLEMSEADIDAYVNSGEALGKAGAYAIQETGDRFAKIVQGSFYNVVGLPVEKMSEILASMDIHVELS